MNESQSLHGFSMPLLTFATFNMLLLRALTRKMFWNFFDEPIYIKLGAKLQKNVTSLTASTDVTWVRLIVRWEFSCFNYFYGVFEEKSDNQENIDFFQDFSSTKRFFGPLLLDLVLGHRYTAWIVQEVGETFLDRHLRGEN